MSLTEKLEELGYVKRDLSTFEKLYGNYFARIYLDLSLKKIYSSGVVVEFINNQKNIDNIQITFNNLKRDLKEIERCIK